MSESICTELIKKHNICFIVRYFFTHQGIINMEITSVKITVVPDEDRLKAYASVVFDNCFVVHDLKIINTENKVFVAMPSRKHKDSFRDVAHPLDKITRKKIQNAVFTEYKKTIRKFQTDDEKLKLMET